MSGPDHERGMATVVVLALGAVLCLTAAVGVLLGGVVAARHRAGSAADFAAIAAAAQPFDASAGCHAAARIAASDGAALERCRIVGTVAEVWVRVDVPGPFRLLGPARATARAARVHPGGTG